MSQTPPPSQPSPMGGNSSAVGANKKTYTILSYIFFWVGGLIFLFVGKDDPDVKWNAANSLIFFGGLTVVMLILSFIPFLNIIAALLWLVGIVYWVIFIVKSVQGNGERIPTPGLSNFLDPYVDRLANSVN
jgi:uncharacterized membrane protein